MFHIYLARALEARLSAVSAAGVFFSGLESSINLDKNQGTTWMLDVQSSAIGHMAQQFPGCIARLEKTKTVETRVGEVSQMAR